MPNDCRKDVLIVTEAFPPLNMIASRRFAQLAPFLERRGWRPWVLTTESGGDLPVPLPPSRIIRRTRILYDLPASPRGGVAAKLRALPVRWAKRTARALGFRFNMYYLANRRWVRTVRADWPAIRTGLPPIDAVIGTFGPAGALELAAFCAGEFRVPWVADFRDLGAMRPDGANALSRRFDLRRERELLRSAAAVTTVSPTLREILIATHALPTEIVYNGWDRDAQSVLGGMNEPETEHTPRHDVYYAGVIYPHQLPSFQLVLEALARTGRGRLTVRALHSEATTAELARMAKALDVGGRLEVLPACGPRQAEVESERAAVNLVVEDLSRCEPAARGTLTGKFLKLVALSPPVLVVARADSDTGPILHETRKGRLCASAAEVAAFLDTVRQRPGLLRGDRAAVTRYAADSQAAVLCSLLDRLTAPSTRERRRAS
jgi:hypothetical protein